MRDRRTERPWQGSLGPIVMAGRSTATWTSAQKKSRKFSMSNTTVDDKTLLGEYEAKPDIWASAVRSLGQRRERRRRREKCGEMMFLEEFQPFDHSVVSLSLVVLRESSASCFHVTIPFEILDVVSWSCFWRARSTPSLGIVEASVRGITRVVPRRGSFARRGAARGYVSPVALT